jgi:hypothetical protein
MSADSALRFGQNPAYEDDTYRFVWVCQKRANINLGISAVHKLYKVLARTASSFNRIWSPSGPPLFPFKLEVMEQVFLTSSRVSNWVLET